MEDRRGWIIRGTKRTAGFFGLDGSGFFDRDGFPCATRNMVLVFDDEGLGLVSGEVGGLGTWKGTAAIVDEEDGWFTSRGGFGLIE